MKPNKKWIILLFKVAVTSAALAYVFSQISLSSLGETLAKASPIPLALATLFFILSKCISSVRLRMFLQSAGLQVSETTNLKLYWLGMFYNLFLPGGIGGDAYKIYLLQRSSGLPALTLGWAVLLDRVNGLLAILMLNLLMVPLLPFAPFWQWVAALSLIPGYLIYYMGVKKLFAAFSSITHQTTLWSFLVQLLQCISLFFIVQALHLQTELLPLLFVFMASSVVAVLPFTIGGIGSREVVFLLGSQWLAIDPDIAVTISLLFFVITAGVSLGGIYYQFLPRELRLPQKTLERE